MEWEILDNLQTNISCAPAVSYNNQIIIFGGNENNKDTILGKKKFKIKIKIGIN